MTRAQALRMAKANQARKTALLRRKAIRRDIENVQRRLDHQRQILMRGPEIKGIHW